MSYRDDNDLEFLERCTNEELRDLFSLLTRDPKDNLKRFTLKNCVLKYESLIEGLK